MMSRVECSVLRNCRHWERCSVLVGFFQEWVAAVGGDAGESF